MTDDERTIRELVDTWGTAAAKRDLDTMLNMLADDVVFLTVGSKPFGKDEFVERFKESVGARIDAKSHVEEVVVSGDMAYLRNHLKVTMSASDGSETKRDGYTLTVFRREPSGRWVLARDANLLPA